MSLTGSWQFANDLTQFMQLIDNCIVCVDGPVELKIVIKLLKKFYFQCFFYFFKDINERFVMTINAEEFSCLNTEISIFS